MNRLQNLRQTWNELLHAEANPGFKDMLRRLTSEGLAAIGWLGVAATILFIGGNMLAGFKLNLSYENGNTHVIWDKLVLLILCILCIFLSRSAKRNNYGRFFMGSLTFIACFAMLMDDVASGSLAFSIPYISIAMFMSVGTTPFKPLHGIFFYLSIAFLYLGLLIYMNVSPNHEPISASRFVYMLMIVWSCIGVNTLLYYSRYCQFLAQERAEELQRQTKAQSVQIKALEEAKTQFFMNLSHEFRTPITLILGAIEDIGQHKSEISPSVIPSLEMAQRNSTRLKHLVDEMLDLARLDEGKLGLNLQHNDIIHFLHDLTTSFQPIANKKQIRLQFFSTLPHWNILFDASQLDKIVSNLLSNAFKFTEVDDKITVQIEASPNEDHLILTISDTGRGISEADQAFIFDRFVQSRDILNSQGSGIGLALVKELVELHEGNISVKSEVGKGTTFTIQLPVQSVVDTDISVRENALLPILPNSFEIEENHFYLPENPPSKNAPLVLLIEDHPDMRLYLKQHLSKRYRIVEAENGKIGIDLAFQHLPDLIISDVMMPEKDGLNVCQTLKQDTKTAHIPIVLLTARATSDDKLEGLKLGADDYLTKPFNPNELLTRAENLIELRQLLRKKWQQNALQDDGQNTASFSISINPTHQISEDVIFLQKAQEVIEQNLANTNFGVEWLASEMALSSRQLQRRITELTTLSAAGYIRAVRLEHAAHLLQNGIGNVSEVASRIGFNDTKHFSKLFHQTFGVLPSQYRA